MSRPACLLGGVPAWCPTRVTKHRLDFTTRLCQPHPSQARCGHVQHQVSWYLRGAWVWQQQALTHAFTRLKIPAPPHFRRIYCMKRCPACRVSVCAVGAVCPASNIKQPPAPAITSIASCVGTGRDSELQWTAGPVLTKACSCIREQCLGGDSSEAHPPLNTYRTK
jgi:hypothetical protein